MNTKKNLPSPASILNELRSIKTEVEKITLSEEGRRELLKELENIEKLMLEWKAERTSDNGSDQPLPVSASK